MGANLYIQSIVEKSHQQWKPEFQKLIAQRNKLYAEGKDEEAKKLQEKIWEVYGKMYPPEGYFRDSYNSTNLLWQLGFSWWEDVGQLLNEESKLNADGIRTLLNMIEKAKPFSLEDFQDNNGFGVPAEEILEYFTRKREAFVLFLKRALALGEDILVSI